mgnify:CR=1 FL=1
MKWFSLIAFITFCFSIQLESKKAITFIVNPISGSKNYSNIHKIIEDNLDHDQFTYSVVFTNGPNHATLLSSQAAAAGSNIIVAVGGDGSVNEVAQGLIGTNSKLAVIPTGSGNGFARHFNIPLDISQSIKVINSQSNQWIDTVKINNKSYLGVAGIGFDADVSIAFSHLDTRGPASYLFVILSELRKYKPKDYELIIDGNIVKEKAFLICFANSKQYGNNAFIAPKAKIDDGFLDVIVWKEFPPFAAPKLIHDLFTKNLDNSKYTKTYRCQEVIIKKPVNALHIDGEPLETHDDVFIRIMPSSVKIISP